MTYTITEKELADLRTAIDITESRLEDLIQYWGVVTFMTTRSTFSTLV